MPSVFGVLLHVQLRTLAAICSPTVHQLSLKKHDYEARLNYETGATVISQAFGMAEFFSGVDTLSSL